jgi:2-keto-4-pentenoate hydratase/2-oxohepta-3-ene-1,7-dioic acid hydratase in catechol pathway
LLLDWTGRTDRWARPTSAPEAPSQVGPFLLVGPLGRRLLDEPLLLRVGTESYRVGAARDGPFRIGEALAYLSQHVALRAGDLVGTGSVHGGRLPATGRPLGYHDRVSVSVPGLATLHGWAVRGPEPVAWRDAHAREEDGRRSQNEP